MRAVLISTYDLGRQPFGLASPAAWLRAAGWDVVCLDLAKDRFDAGRIDGAALVGFHLPMHTATRLAGPIIARTRMLNPSARLCAYGVYAPLNEPWLRALGVDAVFGGEFESELTRWAGHTHDLSQTPLRAARVGRVPRIRFLVRPEGLRSYYLAYPVLDGLRVPMARENVEPDDEDRSKRLNR